MEAEASEIEPTPENREKLARAVVESMDMDALTEFVIQTFYGIYGQIPPENFRDEWEVYLGEKPSISLDLTGR